MKKILALFMLTVLLTACSRNPPPGTPGSATGDAGGQVSVGLASYYGVSTNDIPDDMTSYEAAHRTLPIGTKIQVTNLENNRSLVATVAFSGPDDKEQILQLSFSAARDLNMLSSVVKVRVEVVHD